MLKFFLRRLCFMILTLWVICTLSFFFMKAIPGTPFEEEKIPPAVLENMKAKYGLDKPVPEQYAIYLSNVVQLDFGVSYRIKNREVTTIIAEKIGPSAAIGLQAVAISIPFGILLGIIAAIRRNTLIDYLAVGIAVFGFAIPSFVAAVLLQYVIAGKLELLPIAQFESYKHTILPSLAIALGGFAYYTRMMRSELLEVLGQDYIKTAKSKGLSQPLVLMRHGIRNAMIPLITSLPVVIIFSMTGSLVVEEIFAIPGIGKELVTSVITRDYTVTMGLTLFYAILYIISLFIVDLLYSIVDPRIRVIGGD
ncbi:ABC transporter permease [Cytobacillus sp. IB215665]|uniref:ABC transporter permease n=1 Tax=Cytobacillus sp. IB215665 TaxID=3097357 RepID=UPI002A13E536|nr:ABC transporter permease [Cytobacillus sp. IB215665]MDX8366360.1 ABC transporter permease [Cytobacillus sp. IB215665]